MKANMAWRKWCELLYAHNMPPAEQIKHLQFAVAQARKEMKIHETALEKIILAQTTAAFDSLGEDKRRLLKSVMTRMCTVMQRMVFKEWVSKCDNYERYRALQTGMLNRMLRSYLNKGWIAWEFYDKACQSYLSKCRIVKHQKTIDILKHQIEKLDAAPDRAGRARVDARTASSTRVGETSTPPSSRY